MTEPDENENLANQVAAECYTETSGASPEATVEVTVVTEPALTPDEMINVALLQAQTNEALGEKPFVTENVTVTPAKSYTLQIQPDITPEEATRLALFCFSQVLAQNREISMTVEGMRFENFSRHFKETV